MKRLYAIIFSVSFIGAYNYSFSQHWKQYSDSAQMFSILGTKKNSVEYFNKAVEFYDKAKEILQKDSSGTLTYALISNNFARLYTTLGQYKNAEPLWIEAKNIRNRVLGNKDTSYAESCNGLGYVYYMLRENENAESEYMEAKNIRLQVFGLDHYHYASSCNNLGILYIQMRQFEKAEFFIREAIRIRKNLAPINNHPDYASSIDNLAIVYMEKGEYKEAEPYFLEAKNIREKTAGKMSINYGTSCTNLASYYTKVGDYASAEPLYSEALLIIKANRGEDYPDYAACSNNLAIMYRELGKYELALSYCIKAKDIREKLFKKLHPLYANSCENLAAIYSLMGQNKKAEQLFIEAKTILENNIKNPNSDYAGVCNDLGNLYDNTGQSEIAENLFLKSVQANEVALGKGSLNYALSIFNLAIFYMNMGLFEKAEPLFLVAKKIREDKLGKEHPLYALCCGFLAELYKKTYRYNESESLYLEAEKIIEKSFGKNQINYATNCDQLAELYQYMGLNKKAEFLFIEAKKLREEKLGKDHPDYAASCNNLGNLYLHLGQYKEAESLFFETKKIIEKIYGKVHPSYILVCYNIAIVYMNEKLIDKAKEYFVEAYTYENLNQKNIFKFTSEKEKQLFLKQRVEYNSIMYSFFATNYPFDRQAFCYDVSLLNRNRILSSSQKVLESINNNNDTSIKTKYNEWIKIKKQIAFWATRPLSVRIVNIKDLEEQANTLEKELAARSAFFKEKQENGESNWKRIKNNMKLNEASIEFVEYNYFNGKRWTDSTYYIALVLRKDRPEPILVQLFEKRQLDTLLNSGKTLNTYKRINTVYAKNKLLYNLIWTPLEKYLSGIKRVNMALAGNLFKVSFAALLVNDKQLLSDQFQLTQLNSTATVTDKFQYSITSLDKIQLYGGIKYELDSETLKMAALEHPTSNAGCRSLPDDLIRTGDYQFLLNTEKEVEEIKKEATNINVFVTMVSGISATEESFKVLNGTNSPTVLHIATHGFFFPDPKVYEKDSTKRMLEMSGKVFRQSDNPLFRSGLLFAGANIAWRGKSVDGIEDGILTAYEVSNMYLPNTKLVVLSACETALGEVQGSEGVYGLQRAFKMAGVQYLVMSLWEVPDAETTEFMQLFYKNLFAKQTIDLAFSNTQQVMKNKYRGEPYKWAAWIMVR